MFTENMIQTSVGKGGGVKIVVQLAALVAWQPRWVLSSMD